MFVEFGSVLEFFGSFVDLLQEIRSSSIHYPVVGYGGNIGLRVIVVSQDVIQSILKQMLN